jgi:hypothetical protein
VCGFTPFRLLKPSSDYLKKNAERNLAKGLLCLVVFLVLFVTSIDNLPFYVNAGCYETVRGIALGLFVAGCYYFLGLQYPSWRRGWIGEQRVTETLLAGLSDEYSLFNNVMLKDKKGGDIDHIVVGPSGVFVVETKNFRGKISYYEDNWEGVGRQSPSRQARSNATRIRKVLVSSQNLESRHLWVQGIVVLANTRVTVTPRKPPEHVEVFKINELVNYIKGQPRRFGTWEIGQIETEIRNKI